MACSALEADKVRYPQFSTAARVEQSGGSSGLEPCPASLPPPSETVEVEDYAFTERRRRAANNKLPIPTDSMP